MYGDAPVKVLGGVVLQHQKMVLSNSYGGTNAAHNGGSLRYKSRICWQETSGRNKRIKWIFLFSWLRYGVRPFGFL